MQKIGENISARRAGSVEAPVVGGYVHSNNRIAVVVGLSGGTEELAKEVAMHVAAVNPAVVSSDQMPADVIEAERAIYTAQAIESGKPPEIAAKMVEGRVGKFLKESSLVDQPFEVVSFVRFEVGEGIEVAEVDFAAEVAAQVAGASE